jgi:hypothetical protein
MSERKAEQQELPGSALKQRKLMEGMLITRCWQDEEFKKKLLADPKAAVNEAFGIELPASVRLTVKEESPTALIFSLPAKVTAESELSELELEQVASGKGGATPTYQFGYLAQQENRASAWACAMNMGYKGAWDLNDLLFKHGPQTGGKPTVATKAEVDRLEQQYHNR